MGSGLGEAGEARSSARWSPDARAGWAVQAASGQAAEPTRAARGSPRGSTGAPSMMSRRRPARLASSWRATSARLRVRASYRAAVMLSSLLKEGAHACSAAWQGDTRSRGRSARGGAAPSAGTSGGQHRAGAAAAAQAARRVPHWVWNSSALRLGFAPEGASAHTAPAVCASPLVTG